MSSPAILSDIRKALARSCLAAFVRYTMPGYRMGWVHEEICSELDAFLADVVAGRSPRLMLTMPPRHGKSELASRRFPAYALGRYPDLSVISTSYAADLSSRMNRDVQRVIDSPEYRELFPGTALYGKNIRTVGNGSYLRNSDIFEVVGHAGCYRSAGVGGGITGMGGHIVIVDDPFKDRASADSRPSARTSGTGTRPRCTRASRPVEGCSSSTLAGTWLTSQGGCLRPPHGGRATTGA